MPSATISLGVAAVLLAPPSSDDKPAATRPAATAPAKTPAAPPKSGPGPATGDKPAAGKPAGEKPAGDKSAGTGPAAGKPAGEKPAGEKPAGDKSAGTGPGAGDEPATGDAPGTGGEPATGESDTGTSAAASGSAVPAGRQYSARGPSESGTAADPSDQEDRKKQDKWIHRYPPRAGMAEFGVFGGVWFPNKRVELFLPEAGYQRLGRVTPEIGLRAGYYPLKYLGVELEGAVMPTRTAVTEARATAWAFRGNVIGQLGLWSVTPFLLAGAGVLGVASADGPEGIGDDQDFAVHLGTGVKVFVNNYIQLRLDLREVFSNRRGVGEGWTASPEILLGISFTLGKRTPEEKVEPPPPPEDDRDRDTVPDEEDFCPDVFGIPPRGCPQVCIDDNDADGLSNPEDKCPEDPENRNGFQDKDGCPDEIPPELDQIAGVMEGIYFDNDMDVVKPESKPVLDNAVDILERNPDIRVKITGHTSLPGGYRHNIDLSHRRANSVRRYLVDHGIEPSRLETDGVGPDQPIDTNETKEGQARNRRIEFTILEDE